MNWLMYVWRLIQDALFRKAVASMLWPNVIQPFLQAAVKKIFQEIYQAVYRAVDYTEKKYQAGEITKEEKHLYAFKQIDNEMKAYGLGTLSTWGKNILIEIAVAELDKKWDEFYGGD